MGLKDNIRAKTVGAPKLFQNERIKLGDDEVEVRQPTVRDRGLVLDSAGDVDPETKKVKIDLAKLQVNAVIACCFVPDTQEKVFEEADRSSLENMPAGGWFDDLAKAAQRMLNVDLDDAKNA